MDIYMAKVTLDEEFCPHCKRHCSLNNPHCGKGRELAKEKKKADKVSEAVLEMERAPLQAALARTGSELRLLSLFQICSRLLPGGIEETQRNKLSNKEYRTYVLSCLAVAGVAAQKELEEYLGLSSEELEKILSKLEEKGFINRNLQNLENRKISLTDSGFKAAQVKPLTFSVLEEEEKKSLESILRKVSADWSK